MPIPKKINEIIFSTKDVICKERVKNAAIKAGLQGIIIVPKKNPYKKAEIFGLLEVGGVIFGNKEVNSILRIKKILIIIKMINAIGVIIPITLVKETSKSVVKTKPKNIIKEITPLETKIPNNKTFDLESLLVN
jgi:hypothetical protein